ncbi:DUF6036 family nucleotidyltransferase [Pseudidiomarina sp. E22-M8]|uniref:DUF6036 family nucleotidyltransferase n=1 Tax=Pseudidiomarina sp. E22-M8 TaxID=3424768 RepID=UPI00403CECAF
MRLHTDTAMSKAIFELLHQIDNAIAQRLNNAPDGSVKAYIFGGCAVHLLANSRGSNDLDIYLDSSRLLEINDLLIDVEDVYYEDPELGASQLVLDDTFNPSISPVMIPDYKGRAFELETGAHVLHTYIAHPIDISISKLSRCAVDDVNDIVALYNNGHFMIEEFRQAANIAAKYSNDEQKLRLNIEHVILKLESA